VAADLATEVPFRISMRALRAAFLRGKGRLHGARRATGRWVESTPTALIGRIEVLRRRSSFLGLADYNFRLLFDLKGRTSDHVRARRRDFQVPREKGRLGLLTGKKVFTCFAEWRDVRAGDAGNEHARRRHPCFFSPSRDGTTSVRLCPTGSADQARRSKEQDSPGARAHIDCGLVEAAAGLESETRRLRSSVKKVPRAGARTHRSIAFRALCWRLIRWGIQCSPPDALKRQVRGKRAQRLPRPEHGSVGKTRPRNGRGKFWPERYRVQAHRAARVPGESCRVGGSRNENEGRRNGDA